MLMYIGVSDNPAVLDRVRRWLTNTYGATVTRCVETTIEVASLCIINSDVRAVVADLPQGKLLHDRYDELAQCTSAQTRIVLINPNQGRIAVPAGPRQFSLVPLQTLETALGKVLHAR